MKRALEQALRLAQIREIRAQQQLRDASQRARKAEHVVDQLGRYAGEYRTQAMIDAMRGASASALCDALGFQRRLLAAGTDHAAVLESLRAGEALERQRAAAARRRIDGLGKLHDAQLRLEDQARARRDASEIEDGLVARGRIVSDPVDGTNDA